MTITFLEQHLLKIIFFLSGAGPRRCQRRSFRAPQPGSGHPLALEIAHIND